MNRLSHIRATWRTGHYLVVGAIMFLIVLAGVIFRNIDAIVVVYEATGSLSAALSFLWALLKGLTTVLSPVGALLLIGFGLLFGMNVVLLTQYIRRKRQQTICIDYSNKGHGATISGTVASIFGIGCAACGSAILLAFLNIFGAGGLLLILPLHGEEFGILGLLLLAYATWRLLGSIYSSSVRL